MADNAQAEPTMEEILASIRKIIADDGDTSRSSSSQGGQKTSPVEVNMSEDDDFDDLSLDDVTSSADEDRAGLKAHGDPDFDLMSEEDTSGSLLADVDDDMFDDLAAEEETPLQPSYGAPAEPPVEDELEDFDFGSLDEPQEPGYEQPAPAWAGGDAAQSNEESWETHAEEASDAVADDLSGAAPQPESDFADELEFEPEAVAEPEPMMQTEVEPEPEYEPVIPEVESPELAEAMTETPSSEAPKQTASSGLTDERIAGAAASALGKLMVKQSASASDDGNPNTLDGLMKELLRPMIKEWLDANLPGIVERKVEEEVQRIARMAR